MLVIMLVISSTFFPALQGSHVKSIIDTQLKHVNLEEDDLSLYLKQIQQQKTTNKNEVFREVQRYLSIDEAQGSIMFDYLCNRLVKDMGPETFDEFMHFLFVTLQYLNTHDMDIKDINTGLYEKILSIQNGLESEKNEADSLKSIIEKNQEYLNGIKFEETGCMNSESTFERYWTEYGKAKCYWDGYMPTPTGNNGYAPNKNRNVNQNKIFSLWAGENFYDWHQYAIDYIIGLDDQTGKATFVQLIILGVGASAIMLIVSSIIWSIGFFSGNEDWILIGGFVALIGLLCASLTAFYLYRVLYYFLYGSNAYFEMQRYGNVDLIVHVTDETGSSIPVYMTVTAKNTDAVLKYDQGEPVYPGFTDVNWSSEEFIYDLARVNDQYGNPEVSTFCLHAAQESPEKWKKAVPPPGNWVIYIDANGYETNKNGYPIPAELGVGDCYSMTIQLKEKE